MRDIWLISDTHFGHNNIIRYCDRPFYDSLEMNEKMVDNWNSVVKDGDIVYHLGDVYFPGGHTKGYWDNFWPRLKGRKRLVLGNHDNAKDQYLQRTFKKIGMWRMFPEFGLILTHVPIHQDSFRDAMVNVHGHTHEKGSPKGPYKSVCVELINYTPVNIEELRVV